jgi:hypothetical protein
VLGAALFVSPQIGSALASDFGQGTDNYLYAQRPLAQAYVEVAGGIWNSSGIYYGGAGATGAVNIPVSGGWNVSPELSAVSVFSTGIGTTFTGVLHAYYRDPQSHALGVYAGGINNTANGGSFVVGLDGLLYMNRTTLYAQAGYFTGSGVGQGGQIVGTARYFPADNTKLEGSVGYAASTAGLSVLGFTAAAEQRFEQTPFSAFVSGTYFAIPSSGNQSVVMMGARMYFNNESLFQNDREGVTTDFVKLF